MAPTAAQVLAAVKASGVRYELCAKWNDSSIAAKGSWSPSYVIEHHTANGGASGNAPSLAFILRGSYPPVRNCHFLVARDGLVYVVYALKCYHAGVGGPGQWGNGAQVPADSMNNYGYGIEIESKGTSTSLAGNNGYTPAQVEATAKLTKALLAMMKKNVACAINHKTWAPRRKTDTLYADSWWHTRIAAAGTGDDDVPLTDAEIDKIATAAAKKVWATSITSVWTGKASTASGLLAQANFYAIMAGLVGVVPEGSRYAGQDTTAKVILAAASDDAAGGTGATPDQIADELAQRLEE